VIAQSTLRKFSRFIVIGGLGFVVDAGLLMLFLGLGGDPFISRIASILLAMLVTWRLNRAFTFGASDGSQLSEAGRYFSVAASVAVMNYAIYAGLLLVLASLHPLLATAISTLICVLASFAGYGRFAFRRA
jgi:putative flippase GtrA